jgi:uncharacterized protein YbjT (DUF2867 family)
MYMVAGATSQVGRLVVEKLQAKGVPVRVLVRRTDVCFGDAEVAVGDVRDPNAVASACDGVTTVVSLVGRHFARTQDGFWQVDYQGNLNLMRAARSANAEHFVLMSALWADRDPGPVIFRVKHEAEEALRDSGLRYTILRPPIFVLGPSSLIGMLGPTIERFGLALLPGDGSKQVSPITPEDVADAFVQAALRDGGKSAAIDLAGAESSTLREWAEYIGEVLGKRVVMIPLKRPLLRALRAPSRALGFGPYEAVLFLEMLANHGFYGDSSATRQLLRREPASARDAIRTYYATTKKTPWRESNYGVLVFRSR